MKHILAVLFLLVAGSLFAQETVFGDIESGGYGGPYLEFGPIHGGTGVLVGGKGGWIINHSLIIGGGGAGLANHITTHNYGDSSLEAVFGYGGLIVEYVFMSDRVIHATASVLIGGGGAGTHKRYARDNFYDNQFDMSSSSAEPVFVAQPAVNVEVNFTKFMRVDLGIGYRYVSGVTYAESTNADFSGVSGIVTFKFGKF